jgi:hypothetical protein
MIFFTSSTFYPSVHLLGFCSIFEKTIVYEYCKSTLETKGFIVKTEVLKSLKKIKVNDLNRY